MAIQGSTLVTEIERYLETVDAFRAEGAEPTWANDEAPPAWWLEEQLESPARL
jgi:hypothetical protein